MFRGPRRLGAEATSRTERVCRGVHSRRAWRRTQRDGSGEACTEALPEAYVAALPEASPAAEQREA